MCHQMLTVYTHLDDGLMDDTCLFTGDKASALCGDDRLVRRLALRQLLLMYGPKKL